MFMTLFGGECIYIDKYDNKLIVGLIIFALGLIWG